ncbi:glycosyltransferase family 2 protein [Ligilactobacillus equi]|uniref:Glycosyltransferase 2-like domain-containing protein n=1 Tax=Ligilactobacillus equi DSM 15833 = JCM 10991 TaxID=1423740 RepID=A0A0R1TEZ6_9LACO|nr:glycosyltransferase family A protein [Ligilactobacillus equi]KRL79702.1 hypothetical protein FC36_GL000401 [Ligilactobacillus equi DSM 15833 = JCM 10991]
MISFIIPVYNAEKYINRCLDSFLAQTSKDFELIIVDDGSSDKSIELVQNYCSKINVRIVLSNHTGVSHARNVGLEVAKGDIIGFCDIDDVVSSELVASVKKSFDCNTDIVYVLAKEVQDNNIEKFLNNYNFSTTSHNISVNNFLDKILFDDSVYGSVWNKFFSPKVISSIFFDESLNMCEDLEFLYRVINKQRDTLKIKEISKILYGYVQSGGSTTKIENLYTDTKTNEFSYGKALKQMINISPNMKEESMLKAKLFEIASYSLIKGMYSNFGQRTSLINESKGAVRCYLSSKHYSNKHKIKRIVKCVIKILG